MNVAAHAPVPDARLAIAGALGSLAVNDPVAVVVDPVAIFYRERWAVNPRVVIVAVGAAAFRRRVVVAVGVQDVKPATALNTLDVCLARVILPRACAIGGECTRRGDNAPEIHRAVLARRAGFPHAPNDQVIACSVITKIRGAREAIVASIAR